MENYIEHEVLTINPAGAEESRDAYHIMFGADEQYVKYAGIVITSILLLNYGPKRPVFAFHICTDSLAGRDREHLEETAFKYRVPIYVHFMPENVLEMLPGDMLGAARLSKGTYFRLWGFSALVKYADMVLYMDSDMMVTDCKFLRLWDMKRDKNIAVSVPDVSEEGKIERLGTARYFCAGLILMDVKAWQSEGLTKKCVAMAAKNMYPQHDQDVLNIVLNNRWTIAPVRYDWLLNITDMVDEVKRPQDIVFKKEKATVWHFGGGGKPWVAWTQPLKIAQYYRRIVEQSAWSWDEVVLYPGDLKPRYKHYHKAARSERKVGHYGGAVRNYLLYAYYKLTGRR